MTQAMLSEVECGVFLQTSEVVFNSYWDLQTVFEGWAIASGLDGLTNYIEIRETMN